ncbi:hypothetical protein TBLA_0A05110 [Henningerozyma blattae CBS 6284]|uniref:Succinate dehydrogenase assembly factor 3 n=1 Tax=Henningerozyma blattae (strain ATCC 34711 / CBS 6284 / DSM 70876 / NBRC 10599 / NRRL Y-10934 / UCD 77-7) TaxID=1071380 RepID=I2GW02_HENB6|nr:hypothetical protein TBLA_0A05110 [Tetrapisispora blattae CBS 6284]CCH58304.1 hypothetical protein TBLA_0A05110 [Tetrapisispora blattae CBS 6284]
MKGTRQLLMATRRSVNRPPRQLLLPPLQLYRRILREHKNLPQLQRELGNQYLKNEFRLHKDIENPLHIVGFLTSWQDYLSTISNGSWDSEKMTSAVLEKMSPEQITQLYELMKETQNVRDGTPETTNETKTE